MKRSRYFLGLMAATALGLNAAQATETCYGFSGLQDGRIFNIGESYPFEDLKVNVRDYLRNGGIQNPDGHFIQVKSTRIAGSAATEQSELYVYGARMQIVPRQPVTQVRFRLAENQGNPQIGRHANIAINGRVHEVVGGLAGLDGKEVADDAGGLYRIKVTFAPQVGDWSQGTMRVQAVSGQITSFAIGSTPMVVDDVCITPNAP